MATNFLFEVVYKARDFFGYFISSNLLWLQLGSLFLSLLFLWGIIYILAKTNYINSKIENLFDSSAENLFRYRSIRVWKQIKRRLSSDDPEQWKAAILESDNLLNEILKMSGHIGNQLENKLEEINKEQLPSLEEIKKVHETVNSIKIDLNFLFTKEIVLKTIDVYQKAFIELHLIDQ